MNAAAADHANLPFLVALSACEVFDYAAPRAYTMYLVHLPLFYVTRESAARSSAAS
jgi:hypothetical protein